MRRVARLVCKTKRRIMAEKKIKDFRVYDTVSLRIQKDTRHVRFCIILVPVRMSVLFEHRPRRGVNRNFHFRYVVLAMTSSTFHGFFGYVRPAMTFHGSYTCYQSYGSRERALYVDSNRRPKYLYAISSRP